MAFNATPNGLVDSVLIRGLADSAPARTKDIHRRSVLLMALLMAVTPKGPTPKGLSYGVQCDAKWSGR
jgi:hypothetical protein